MSRSTRREAVLARVRAIPEGFVRTYGDVSPGAPRFAGTVLFDMPDDPDLPWWRVVRADGSLAKGRARPSACARRASRCAGGRVNMREARLPEDVDPA